MLIKTSWLESNVYLFLSFCFQFFLKLCIFVCVCVCVSICCYEYQNKNNCEIDFKMKLKEEFLYKNYRYLQILIYLSIPSDTRAKNFTYIRYTFRNVQIFENVFFRVSFVVFKLKLYVTFRRDRLLYLDFFWVFLVCSILSALE